MAQIDIRHGELDTIKLESHPGYNRVLVRREPHKKVTDGGIVLPNKGQAAQFAEVLAVGPGRISRKTGKPLGTEIKKGDRVLIGTEGGQPKVHELADGTTEVLFILMDPQGIQNPNIQDVAEILAVVEAAPCQ